MKKLFENVGDNNFRLTKQANEMHSSDTDVEFEKWIKKYNPGLTSDNIAYDIARDAFLAGIEYAEIEASYEPRR